MGLVLFTILPQGGYAQTITNTATQHSYVTEMVQNVLNVYNAYYNYPHQSLTISYGETEKFTPTFMPGGGQQVTLLYAEPGNIYINQRTSVNQNDIWHELFHTYKCTSPNLLSAPISFTDGYILGTQGMNLRIQLKSGVVTGFSSFEEASAEYLAFKSSGGTYRVGDPGYAGIGSLMIKICNSYGLSPTDILRYQSEGDGLFQFIKKISAKNNIDVDNILFLMTRFSQVQQFRETPNQAMSLIQNRQW